MSAPKSSPFLGLWGWPIVLGVLSASGLLSALVSDTWGDPWSWVALGIPVVVMAWFGWRRERAPDRVRSPSAPNTSDA